MCNAVANRIFNATKVTPQGKTLRVPVAKLQEFRGEVYSRTPRCACHGNSDVLSFNSLVIDLLD